MSILCKVTNPQENQTFDGSKPFYKVGEKMSVIKRFGYRSVVINQEETTHLVPG